MREWVDRSSYLNSWGRERPYSPDPEQRRYPSSNFTRDRSRDSSKDRPWEYHRCRSPSRSARIAVSDRSDRSPQRAHSIIRNKIWTSSDYVAKQRGVDQGGARQQNSLTPHPLPFTNNPIVIDSPIAEHITDKPGAVPVRRVTVKGIDGEEVKPPSLRNHLRISTRIPTSPRSMAQTAPMDPMLGSDESRNAMDISPTSSEEHTSRTHTGNFEIPRDSAKLTDQHSEVQIASVERQRLLMKYMQDCMQAYATVAVTSLRREDAQLALNKKRREAAKWRNQHENYTSFVQEQESDRKTLDVAVQRFDAEITKQERIRDSALKSFIRLVGFTAQSASVSETRSANKQLEYDTAEQRTEVQTLDPQTASGAVNSRTDTGNTLQLDTSQLRNVQSDIANIKNRLEKIDTKVDRQNIVDAATCTQLASVSERIDKLETDIASVQNLKTSSAAIEDKISHIVKDSEAFRERLTSFHEQIAVANEKSTGLKDLHAEHETRHAEHETRLGDFHEYLKTLSNQLDEHDNRMDKLITQGKSVVYRADLDSAIVTLNLKSAELEAGMTRLQGEHRNIVAREIEGHVMKLKGEIVSTKEGVQKNKELLQALDIRVAASQRIQPQVVPSQPQLQPQPQPQSQFQSQFQAARAYGHGSWIPRTQQSQAPVHVPHTQLGGQVTTIQELGRHMRGCQVHIQSLTQRMDNMTTESMARQILDVIQSEYVYPVQVAQDLAVLKKSCSDFPLEIKTLKQRLTALSAKVESIEGPSGPSGPSLAKDAFKQASNGSDTRLAGVAAGTRSEFGTITPMAVIETDHSEKTNAISKDDFDAVRAEYYDRLTKEKEYIQGELGNLKAEADTLSERLNEYGLCATQRLTKLSSQVDLLLKRHPGMKESDIVRLPSRTPDPVSGPLAGPSRVALSPTGSAAGPSASDNGASAPAIALPERHVTPDMTQTIFSNRPSKKRRHEEP